MKSIGRYALITKIVGAFMVLIAAIGFIVLKDADLGPRTTWETLYMLAVFVGGTFNLLDLGKGPFSILALVFYIISTGLSATIGIVFLGALSPDLLLMAGALLISSLRCNAVLNKENADSDTGTSDLYPPHTSGSTVEEGSSIISASSAKCCVGIMRQSKVSFGGREFNIYVDGIKATSIKNGAMTRLVLAPGDHVLGFGVGAKITSTVTLTLNSGDEANVMCYAKGNGVEAVLTAVDVCALANAAPPASAQTDGGGCLSGIIGLILILVGLSILFGIRIVFFFYPIH